MGESDEAWAARCKTPAIVDGVKIDPLGPEEEDSKMEDLESEQIYGEEDPDEKYHF